jgi:hypothetical protein
MRYRYARTDIARTAKREANRNRIFVGEAYYGRAATDEQARQINAHIKERVSAFKQGQSNREEAESA